MPNSVIQSTASTPSDPGGSTGRRRKAKRSNGLRVRRPGRAHGNASAHRYEQLRKSQQKLAWCMAAGVVFGALLGYGVGNVAIGIGTGLALGLASGILASG